jgi:hypothetical protein
MKEKIEEIVVYHGKESILRRYFELDTPTEDIIKVLEVSFPKEYKLWSRKLIGGNKGAHCLND